MPSYVTPKKNTAFVFYVSLEDKANPGLFKASPTLAAGDVRVATDDGAPGNAATLPTVDADFTKRLKVSLSAGEMNGDNVTVIFSDAAGAEWYDLQVNLQTTAQQIDDLSLTNAIADSYSTAGAQPTYAQAILETRQFLQERIVSGVNVTVRKPNGSTTAMTFLLDDGTNPTEITRNV
jgi:hypothetical protein